MAANVATKKQQRLARQALSRRACPLTKALLLGCAAWLSVYALESNRRVTEKVL
jgi:hypothetical protein